MTKESRTTLIWVFAALVVFSVHLFLHVSKNAPASHNRSFSILDSRLAAQTHSIHINSIETGEHITLVYRDNNWFLRYEEREWPVHKSRAQALVSFMNIPLAIRTSGGNHRSEYTISLYDSAQTLLSHILVGGTDSLGRGRYIKTAQSEQWLHAIDFPPELLRVTSSWWADLEPWQELFTRSPLVHISGLSGSDTEQMAIAEDTIRSLRVLDIAPYARLTDISDRITLVLGDTVTYSIGLGMSADEWIIGDMDNNRFWYISEWSRRRLLDALGR